MSTRRSPGALRPRHIATGQGWALARVVLAGAALFGTVACGDSLPTSPLASASLAPAAERNGQSQQGDHGNGVMRDAAGVRSRIVSRRVIDDTTITVFVVGTRAHRAASISLGDAGRIVFPEAAGSICDPARSSYGPGTWDDPCVASSRPITITARVWVNGQTGNLSSDFEPALRFVPGAGPGVTLHLQDRYLAPTSRLDYCANGVCVDEAASDTSLATHLDRPHGFAYRRIKHFSGYSVVVD